MLYQTFESRYSNQVSSNQSPVSSSRQVLGTESLKTKAYTRRDSKGVTQVVAIYLMILDETQDETPDSSIFTLFDFHMR